MGTVVSNSEIEAIAKKLKEEGKIVVTTNGSFDLVHTGHIKSLQEAKKHGDVLILALNSDKSVQSYKSKDRPIIPEADRAHLLAALECIDYVTLFDEDDPNRVLDMIKPNVHVKSRSGYLAIEEETIKKNGGTIQLIDDIPGKSTTEIINKIVKVYGNQ